MTTVVIVDDHPVVRAGLTARLATRPGIEVVGEAGGGSAALAVVGRERPDVVLMDLQLGADNGVAVTRELLRRDPRARVLILTTYDTDADIVAARGEAVFAPPSPDASRAGSSRHRTSSPNGSARSWRCWPKGWPTARSHAGCSCRRRR